MPMEKNEYSNKYSTKLHKAAVQIVFVDQNAEYEALWLMRIAGKTISYTYSLATWS